MMFPKIDLRNHSFLRGESQTQEEMVLSAIKAGAQAIGFSYPAATSFSLRTENNRKSATDFRRETERLSKKYCGQIAVLLGEERDFYADPVFPPCDYIVGSVHFLVADDGAVCPLDRSAGQILADVKAHFAGNMNQMIRRYFETVAVLARKTRCNYIADFDYLQTFNLENRLFDPASPAYRSAALDAMEALVREDIAFEIGLRERRAPGHPGFSPSPEAVRWLTAHRARFFAFSNDFSACGNFAKSCGAGGFSYWMQGEWKTILPGGKS